MFKPTKALTLPAITGILILVILEPDQQAQQTGGCGPTQ